MNSNHSSPYASHDPSLHSGHVTNSNTSSYDARNKSNVSRPPRGKGKSSGGPRITKSSLNTNFDPMQDRHMWAMWRTAVNGRIMDQVRKNEQVLSDPFAFHEVINGGGEENDKSMFVKDLTTAPPLSRFIRLNQKSKNIAEGLMSEGQGRLETTQFIYYGLPRVTVGTGRQHNGPANNVPHPNPPVQNGYHQQNGGDYVDHNSLHIPARDYNNNNNSKGPLHLSHRF